MLQAGIVVLPNVGKSTLFNALTKSHKAQAENYPFCTIDPNVGVVKAAYCLVFSLIVKFINREDFQNIYSIKYYISNYNIYTRFLLNKFNRH